MAILSLSTGSVWKKTVYRMMNYRIEAKSFAIVTTTFSAHFLWYPEKPVQSLYTLATLLTAIVLRLALPKEATLY